MDRIENYRQILERVVKRHAQFQPANGNIQTHAVCDRETDEFMVIDSGWNEKGRRIYDVVLHFRLQEGNVYVERDNTDAEVVRELIENGIDKENIILAYKALPFQKLEDLIVV
jgi:hypothetical protein